MATQPDATLTHPLAGTRLSGAEILVHAVGAEAFTRMVEEEWAHIRDSVLKLDQSEIDRVRSHFPEPDYDRSAAGDTGFNDRLAGDAAFGAWVKRNVRDHKVPGYRVVFISLKAPGVAPGDATHEQMDAVADLADRYSHGEIVTTHDQNLLLPHVRQGELYEVWQGLARHGLATPNIGLLTDMICCPGLDFCSLANASSISIAKQIQARFDDMDYLHDIGAIKIKMSGCMNACGHHHVGHIGILGVDKKGEEFYQLTLGGSAENDAALGDRLGPGIAKDKVAEAIENILSVYLENRTEAESFLDTYRRIGIEPFKQHVYASPAESEPRRDTVASH